MKSLAHATSTILILFPLQSHGDCSLPSTMLLVAILSNRTFQGDQFQLLIETVEILLNEFFELLRRQRICASLIDVFQEPIEFLTDQITLDRMTQTFLLVIGETSDLFT